jgi:hypothetical protein
MLSGRGQTGTHLDPVARFSNYFEIGFAKTHFLLDFCQAYEDKQPLIQARIAVVPSDAARLLELLREVLAQYRERFPDSIVE